MKDAIVDEMRAIRSQIEREFDHDMNKYLAYVYEAQKKHGGRLIRRAPKPIERRRAV